MRCSPYSPDITCYPEQSFHIIKSEAMLTSYQEKLRRQEMMWKEWISIYIFLNFIHDDPLLFLSKIHVRNNMVWTDVRDDLAYHTSDVFVFLCTIYCGSLYLTKISSNTIMYILFSNQVLLFVYILRHFVLPLAINIISEFRLELSPLMKSRWRQMFTTYVAPLFFKSMIYMKTRC